MRYLASLKCNVLLMLSLSPLLLTACGTPTTQPPPPTAPAQTSASEPLACTDFPVLRFQSGKDGATVEDVQAALAHPVLPLGWVRGVMGDTKKTRDAIAGYQAKRKAIGCKTY